MAKKATPKPILAAGGIVVRDGTRGFFAVVQRSKDSAWVLPRGKLKRNENPVSGARREVVEETGHRVRIYEFLGAITYRAGGRPKVVQFWRMEAEAEPSHALMADITAVEWLPLKAAVRRLSYPLEKLFLRHIGRQALPHRQSPAQVPPQPTDEPSTSRSAATKAGKTGAKKADKAAKNKGVKKADKAADKAAEDKALPDDKTSDDKILSPIGKQMAAHPGKAGSQKLKAGSQPRKAIKADKKVRRKSGAGPAKTPPAAGVAASGQSALTKPHGAVRAASTERAPAVATAKGQTAAERKSILRRMLGRLGR